MTCLHDADDCASAIGEVLDGGYDIGGVEEGLRLRGEQHVDAHERERRGRDPGDGEPHGEVPGGAEDGSREEDEPWAAPARGRPRGEEAREDAGVGADVLEEGDGVERGLVVALGGLERRGVDAEAVGAPRAALDERAGGQGRPARPRPWRRRGHRRRPEQAESETESGRGLVCLFCFFPLPPASPPLCWEKFLNFTPNSRASRDSHAVMENKLQFILFKL